MKGLVSAMALTVLTCGLAGTAVAGDNPWRGSSYYGGASRLQPPPATLERDRDMSGRTCREPATEFPPETEAEALGWPVWVGRQRPSPPTPRAGWSGGAVAGDGVDRNVYGGYAYWPGPYPYNVLGSGGFYPYGYGGWPGAAFGLPVYEQGHWPGLR